MDAACSEKLIQRSIEKLSQHDSPLLLKELESIEKHLNNEEHFLATINSSEILDLIINIFVTSITTMSTISNRLSSTADPAMSVLSKINVFSLIMHSADITLYYHSI
jgi:hypothetical protein